MGAGKRSCGIMFILALPRPRGCGINPSPRMPCSVSRRKAVAAAALFVTSSRSIFRFRQLFTPKLPMYVGTYIVLNGQRDTGSSSATTNAFQGCGLPSTFHRCVFCLIFPP